MRCAGYLYLGALALVLTLPGLCFADDEEPSVRGRKASEWLAILKDQDPKSAKQRRVALVALGILGPKVPGVVPTLAETLQKDPDEDVRVGSAQALGQMGFDAKEGLAALVRAMKQDKSARVRGAAARALGRMAASIKSGTPMPSELVETVAELAGVLKENSAGARAAAAEALGRFGHEARTAFQALVDALQDSDRFVRDYAIFAIGRIGPEAQPAVTKLAEILEKDPEFSVRRTAAEALGRFGPGRGVPAAALGKALQDKEMEVRRAAALALSKLGPDARPPCRTSRTRSRIKTSSSGPWRFRPWVP
jgi:HEAT repeat protein